MSAPFRLRWKRDGSHHVGGPFRIETAAEHLPKDMPDVRHPHAPRGLKFWLLEDYESGSRIISEHATVAAAKRAASRNWCCHCGQLR